MARKTKTKEIDGVEYIVTALGARSALQAAQHLARVMAPLSRGVADKKPSAPANAPENDDKPAASLMDLDIESLPLERVIDRLAEPDTLDMVMLLMKGVAADGRDMSQERAFDDHFSGRIDVLAQVVLLSLEVNFGGFFDRLGASPIGAQMAAALRDAAPQTLGDSAQT